MFNSNAIKNQKLSILLTIPFLFPSTGFTARYTYQSVTAGAADISGEPWLPGDRLINVSMTFDSLLSFPGSAIADSFTIQALKGGDPTAVLTENNWTFGRYLEFDATGNVIGWFLSVNDPSDLHLFTTSGPHVRFPLDYGLDWSSGKFFNTEMGAGVGTWLGSPGGDFIGEPILDVDDIDLLSAAVRQNSELLRYDLTGDNLVNNQDRIVWVTKLKNTYFGDSNLDGEFNSTDLISVFAAGEFETGNDASWSEGDWNGNGRFTTDDFIAAFADGGYERGPLPTKQIPESTSISMIVLAALIGVASLRRRQSCL